MQEKLDVAKDEIERLRKEMLVGSKRGNRFLEGFSTSAVILHSVTLPQLWNRLIEEDQKVKISGTFSRRCKSKFKTIGRKRRSGNR